MNLNHAMLCLDCDEIGLEATHCMLCGSKIVKPLAKWIPPLNAEVSQDETAARREALFAEARAMAKKMTEMMADATVHAVQYAEQPEHLGCGA